MRNKKLARNIGSMSFAVLLSRILGLVRDQFFAYFLGTSFVADAFNVAFTIPNLLRRLFGEGALSAAFIPIYQEIGVKKTKKDQLYFALNILSLLCFFLTILTIIGVFAAPFLVKAIAPGFEQKTYELTVLLTKILFPYLFLIGFSSTLISILNSHSFFFVPGLSSAFLNVGMIGGLVFAVFFSKSLPQNAIYLAYGTLIGGVFQTIVNFPLLKKNGYHFKIILSFRGEALTQLWKTFIPGVWGIAVRQVNLIADKLLASLLVTGSITALQYGNRLMQLPLGIFGVAVGTATIPHFSKCVAEKDWDKLSSNFRFSLLSLAMILLPVTALIFTLGKDYIRVLFMRGAFDEVALNMTFYALCFYSIGLIFYGLNRSIISLFYAFKDTKTPVKISFVIVFVNVMLNLILMKPLGYRGLALSTSLSSILQFIMLHFIAKRKMEVVVLRNIIVHFAKLFIASLVLFLALKMMTFYWTSTTFFHSLSRAFAGSIGGFILFFLLCLLMNVDGIDIILKKRKR